MMIRYETAVDDALCDSLLDVSVFPLVSCVQVKFQLGTKRHLFMEQLEKDASFLASLNIMDYSLLIGIHDRTR